MASQDERTRIEIAFDGGQIITTLVAGGVVEELERSLGSAAQDTFEFDADDGRYTVALKRVLYVKRFARESHVGFSG